MPLSTDNEGLACSLGRVRISHDTLLRRSLCASHDVIVNPLTDGLNPVGISLLYARWEYSDFVSMPVDARSYDGVANFKYQLFEAENNKMSIPFMTSYTREPVCTFTQEGGSEVLLSNIVGFHDKVAVYLFDVNGNPKNWSNMALQFNLNCIGIMSSASTGGE